MFSPRFITPLLATALLLTGCLESTITQNCEQIATQQCQQCTMCATSDPGLDAGNLCGFSADIGETQCVEELTARCENQASARQQLDTDLELCLDALGALDCSHLYEAAAQNRSRTVNQCELLL